MAREKYEVILRRQIIKKKRSEVGELNQNRLFANLISWEAPESEWSLLVIDFCCWLAKQQIYNLKSGRGC